MVDHHLNQRAGRNLLRGSSGLRTCPQEETECVNLVLENGFFLSFKEKGRSSNDNIKQKLSMSRFA